MVTVKVKYRFPYFNYSNKVKIKYDINRATTQKSSKLQMGKKVPEKNK